MKLYLVIITAFLVSCSSMSVFNPPPEYYEAQVARIEAAQALAEKPMVTIECAAGCSVSVLNPNGANSLGNIKEGTTSGKVALAAVGGVKDLGRSLAVVRVADKVMSAAGDRSVTVNGNDNSLDMDNTAITTTNSREDSTSSSVVGNTTGDTSGDTLGASSGDVITSGDTRGDETIRGDVSGDESRVTDSYNSSTSSNTSTNTATTDNSTDTNDENSSTNTTTETPST